MCHKVQGLTPAKVVLERVLDLNLVTVNDDVKNHEMILCDIRKPCSVVSTVGDPFVIPKRKHYRFLNEEQSENRVGESTSLKSFPLV